MRGAGEEALGKWSSDDGGGDEDSEGGVHDDLHLVVSATPDKSKRRRRP